jgi:hypothetical protein
MEIKTKSSTNVKASNNIGNKNQYFVQQYLPKERLKDNILIPWHYYTNFFGG